MPLATGTMLGPYEILRLIGAGGMGEVYQARDTRLGRDVAVKVSAAQFTERFDREARAVAALNHPNICTLHDVGPNYLVMEFVEGEAPKGPLPLDETLRIASQIADALEASHEKGITHRDLKPANIKIKPDGSVKVLDFGLAKMPPTTAGDPENSPTLSMAATQAGQILGTAAYMAPEQAKGKPVDRRADIWAFGVVFYELLTGRRLFEAEDITDTLVAVLTRTPDWDAVPFQVRRMLQCCLERDPKKRLQAIGDMRLLLAAEPPPAPPSVTAPIAPARTPRWMFAVAGVLALALAALAYLHFRETPPPEHVLKYTIALPENITLTSFAVSPDGRNLVIATVGNDGRRQLWLRRMDTLQTQPMTGTDDARFPFWSPDSSYIGFFAQGKLRKVAASGGPSQTLCDAGNGYGGTWNRDDIIVFAPAFGENVIRQVPAAGGVPTDVIKAKATLIFPVFLPDGRHFLYESLQAAEKSGVYVASLDGKENRQIVADPSPAAFALSPSGSQAGHILFLRDNTLVAQPFDAASAQLSGGVFPVQDGVSRIGAFMPVTVSANGLLIHGTGSGGASNQIVWYDRTGKLVSQVSAPGEVWEPSISPDEKTVAFARFTGANSDIWLRDVATGVDRRLTTDASRNDTPIWSPKSDFIVFRSLRSGQQQLHRRAASGSGQDELIPTDMNQKNPTQWTRDFMVYTDNDPKTQMDIWYLPAGESAGKPAAFIRTQFVESQGQVSPDGRWMAFSSDVAAQGQRDVYVRPFPTGDGESRISTTGGEQPRWRGDGNELFFVRADGKMMSVAVKAAPSAKPVFGSPTPLFDSHIAVNTGTSAAQYDVTADGKRFLVATNAAASGSGAASTPPLTVVLNWNSR
jgi:Tol biopolymer transport system component